MPCTTLLVGKKASYDGSTIISRTDDGFFDEKKVIVIEPKDQPRKYKTVISHLEIELPDNPMRYTSSPSINKKNGIWPATGINAANVGMTATETITTNPLVLGADPYVMYKKAEKKKDKDIPGGIGEEDLVTLVLPYIKSAKEGVERLGALLEKYGTYESNGIAFNDENDVWWLESIGGHHWIAKRVKDEEYVVMPNQFGLDNFDFDDAYGAKKDNMCSADLKEFMEKNHLNLNQGSKFNPRNAFGSHGDSDHCYNTPRGWYMLRYFNPTTYKWEGPNADFTPESDNLPWSMVPERKITIEDVKYILSSHYQGTEYDPLVQKADPNKQGKYRPIGINRTGVTGILQIRPYVNDLIKGVEWVSFGPNPYNAALPLYTNVPKMPAYIENVSLDCSTENFYWGSRLIAAMADANFGVCVQLIERYQFAVAARAHIILNKYDELVKSEKDADLLVKANEELAAMAKKETTETLTKVVFQASNQMKCGYYRKDN